MEVELDAAARESLLVGLRAAFFHLRQALLPEPLILRCSVDVREKVDGLRRDEVFAIVQLDLVRGASPQVLPVRRALLMIHAVAVTIIHVIETDHLKVTI